MWRPCFTPPTGRPLQQVDLSKSHSNCQRARGIGLRNVPPRMKNTDSYWSCWSFPETQPNVMYKCETAVFLNESFLLSTVCSLKPFLLKCQKITFTSNLFFSNIFSFGLAWIHTTTYTSLRRETLSLLREEKKTPQQVIGACDPEGEKKQQMKTTTSLRRNNADRHDLPLYTAWHPHSKQGVTFHTGHAEAPWTCRQTYGRLSGRMCRTINCPFGREPRAKASVYGSAAYIA